MAVVVGLSQSVARRRLAPGWTISPSGTGRISTWWLASGDDRLQWWLTGKLAAGCGTTAPGGS